MKWEQFKNRLQKEVHHQRTEVDIEELWNAIEPQVDELNQKRRRKRFFFIWIFFVALLGIGTSVYLLPSQNENKQTSLHPLSSEELSIIKAVGQKKEQAPVNKEVKPSQNKIAIELSETKNTSGSSIDVLANKNKLALEKAKIALDAPRESNPVADNNFTATTNSKIFKNKNNQLSNAVSNSGFKNENNIAHTSSIDLSPDQHQQNILDQKEIKPSASLKYFATLALENRISLLPYQRDIEIFNFPTAKEISVKSNPSFQFSAGIYGGLSYVNRSLKAEEASSQALVDIREKYETMLEASHFGLSFEMQHRSGFQLSLGIRKTAIAERFSLQETTMETELVQGVSSKRINLNGDTVSIMGMIPQTTMTVYNKEIYNTYSLVDIPLLVGYRHAFDKWNVGVEAGILVNLSLLTKGIIPNELLEDIDIKTQQKDYFKSNIGLRYQLGFSVSRTISRKLALSMTTSFQYFPKDISVDTYGISQKYTLLGAQLGLHYRL